MTPEPGDAGAARRARLVLLVFAAFVVYGSFFPFSFRVDPVEVQRDLAGFWSTLALFDARGRRLFSIADLVSNVLLGVPVGALLLLGGLVGRGIVTRGAGALVVEALFAGTVEVGQILAPTRTASALDVLAQSAGAVAGALGAHGTGTAAARRLEAWLATRLRERPALVVVAVLAGLVAADALYPYAVTLDVSTAWGNLRRAQWQPLATLSGRPWGPLLVDRLLPYAGMAFAARWALAAPSASPRPGSGTAVALALLLWAAALEGGKLLIVGRAPSVDNVLVAALGVLLGLVAFATWAGSTRAAGRGARAVVGLTGAALVYRELAPFDWVLTRAHAAAKSGRIEWIPLASYFYADPQSALFDLFTKLVWSGAFGASLRAAGAHRPWAWTLALGLVLESLQVVQVSHVPAVGDVLAFGAGAALGARLLDGVRRWRPDVSIAGH
ncbi:MAG TPA: VanZ family protein [Methylomirabilota bacterium]|nr:VanZ family protein [Methylomirabilota bacterium]